MSIRSGAAKRRQQRSRFAQYDEEIKAQPFQWKGPKEHVKFD